jgi:hypothetical protein
VRIYNSKFWFFGCSLSNFVYAAKSDDGVTWVVDDYPCVYGDDPYSPVVSIDHSPYRSCWMFVGSQAVLYYSAALSPANPLAVYLTIRMNINLIE